MKKNKEKERLVEQELIKLLSNRKYFLETIDEFKDEFTDYEIKNMLENFENLQILKNILGDEK